MISEKWVRKEIKKEFVGKIGLIMQQNFISVQILY